MTGQDGKPKIHITDLVEERKKGPKVHIEDLVAIRSQRPRRVSKKSSKIGLGGLAFICAVVAGLFGVFKGGESSEGGPGECAIPVQGAHLIPEGMWHSSRDKGKRKHVGLDIMQNTGTPIYAVKDGTVEWADFRDPDEPEVGWGRVILLRHSDNGTTLYAHLNGIAAGIDPGVSVKKGQLIAYVGHTGNASEKAPHLHIEFGAPGDRFGNRKNLVPQDELRKCGGWDPKWVEHKAR